jgi:hypothetical protein
VITNKAIVAGLKRVRKRLSKGWTTGSMARNIMDEAVNCMDKTAVKYCPLGAIWVESHKRPELRRRMVDELQASMPKPMSLVGFNDRNKGKQEIIKLVDRTIRRCSAKLKS